MKPRSSPTRPHVHLDEIWPLLKSQTGSPQNGKQEKSLWKEQSPFS